MEGLNVELKAPQRGRVVEPADNPRAESSKKRLAAVGLAAMGAFGLAVLGISWREYRLRRVDSPEEVADGMNLRLVGTLPALPVNSRSRGGAGSGDGGDSVRWHNLLVESVDAARTVILRDCRAEDIRAVMITSATKGEGKSSLSSHLAISLARAGRRTVLVDFDLRSPTAHGLFDVSLSPGVCELLRGECEVEDAARPLMDDLDLIPAGFRDAASIRALAQDSLPRLVGHLKSRYEYVIIDSAPVLPVADSLLISQHVDAVLLSVYREVSRLPAVFAGYERLSALGVRVLGVVVTGLPVDSYGEAYHYSEAGAS
jgi:capsular exopolysaccharide synthesis family protein